MLGYTEAVLWGTTIGSFYNAIVDRHFTITLLLHGLAT